MHQETANLKELSFFRNTFHAAFATLALIL